MNRISLFLGAILLAACSSTTPAGFVFPEIVESWKLKAVKKIPAADAPESIRRLGVDRAESGEYQGPGTIFVQIYEMTSSAAAFETEQTWRPVADTVAFHRDHYFAVIHWENTPRGSVSAFVREIEKRLER